MTPLVKMMRGWKTPPSALTEALYLRTLSLKRRATIVASSMLAYESALGDMKVMSMTAVGFEMAWIARSAR